MMFLIGLGVGLLFGLTFGFFGAMFYFASAKLDYDSHYHE